MARQKAKNGSIIRRVGASPPMAYIGKGRAKLKAFRWWVRWPIYIIIAYLILAGLSWLTDEMMPKVKDPQWGVSFSKEYAQELGNNWQANYTALLNLGFKHIRLMSYWEDIEPTPGHYDFSDLDWEIQQANAHGATVSLAIGYRQPRWPECHEPTWAENLKENSTAWDNALFSYMHVVINRYKNNPAIQSYQMENEVANAWFGSCRGSIPPRSRLITEFNLVKQWDPNHPVWMSLGDEHGLPIYGPVPDAYGFSIYRVVYSTNTPIHFYITYPITDWYHRLREFAINEIHHRPTFVHELQLEPWGPKATEDLTTAQQDQSMSVSQMKKNIAYSEKTGMKLQYMWGGEWWYWRLTKFHDPGPWDVIKQTLQANPQYNTLPKNLQLSVKQM